MRSQLYLSDDLRAFFKSEISTFVQIFSAKLFPVFSMIDEEAEKFSEEYFEKALNNVYDDSIDPASVAETAIDKALSHFSDLSLVRYEFTAMAIATLYLIWEQQMRKFLYRELRHNYKIDFPSFCTSGIKEIKEIFSEHSVDIETMKAWPKLDELRLLCNVVKHGDGGSAKRLFGLNKGLFREEYYKDKNGLVLDTTLLEETLNLNEETFSAYGNVLIEFWSELPERSL
jgi:hypothetical protein